MTNKFYGELTLLFLHLFMSHPWAVRELFWSGQTCAWLDVESSKSLECIFIEPPLHEHPNQHADSGMNYEGVWKKTPGDARGQTLPTQT